MIELTPQAQLVAEKRYFLKNDKGEIIEDAEKMFRRVAKAISEVEKEYDTPKEEIAKVQEDFYRVMSQLDFVPNSPTLMNAGTNQGTLSACFVIPLEDSMEGIMDAARTAAMVQKFGGGTGFSLSKLRQKNAPIKTTHGKACGPIEVLKTLSRVSSMITQGGKRDGANMAVMSVHHPDILEFIECKTKEGDIHNFNISVGVTHAFMKAVKNKENYDLLDPKTNQVVKQINARDTFNKIVEGAWKNGEPGMIFLDRVNEDNAVIDQYGPMTATNPCGEQPLLGNESCNLGSINLARFVKNGEVDYAKLEDTVSIAVRFLDNIIDVNNYATPEVEEMTKATRKIGLGVMGWADMLYQLNIPYSSEEARSLAWDIMAFIKDMADSESLNLSEKRGPAPAYKGSTFEKNNLPYRNICRLTVAPTGTISMLADCSSGIEPTFALAWTKQNILEGQSVHYVNKYFAPEAERAGVYTEALKEHLANGGSLKDRADIPDEIKKVYETAFDIKPREHVLMQAAFQEHVDSGISKTINFPNSATVKDVEEAYMLAYDTGCKGITVYRSGSREKEVLTTGTTKKEKFTTVHRRPKVMNGKTERVQTSLGGLYVTVNSSEEGKAFEVFVEGIPSAKGEIAGAVDGLTRMVSLALRSDINPKEITKQLSSISTVPVWDEGVMIKSIPDGISHVLQKSIQIENTPKEVSNVAEMCDECGTLSVVMEEGCLKCMSCGWSKCG